MSSHILSLPSGTSLDLDHLPSFATLEMLQACRDRILALEASSNTTESTTPKKRGPPCAPSSSSKAMKPTQVATEKKSTVKANVVTPIPVLTPDIIKAAHQLIDFGKTGQWQELFKMLASHKELVNVRPEVREYGALHQAAYHDNKDVLLTLINKYGADPSLPTGSGLSLLEVAEMQGCSAVIETLKALPTSKSVEDMHTEDMDACDNDFDIQQMPDGSWKVSQKSDIVTSAVGAAPAQELKGKGKAQSLETISSSQLEPKGKGNAQSLETISSSSSEAIEAALTPTVTYPVDKYFPQSSASRVYHHEGTTWHCMLKRANQFHLMQLLELSPESYCVWCRWGKAETPGQNETVHFASPELAAAAFQAKFHEKTNNKWENRKSFKQFFGKFTYEPEPGVDDSTPTPSCATLPAPPMTADVAKRAHKLIDLAKVGKWIDLFKQLSTHKNLVNVRPEVRDFNALHQAAFQGKEDVVFRLIDECGADPTQKTKYGKTAADVAEEEGHSQLAEQLRSKIAMQPSMGTGCS